MTGLEERTVQGFDQSAPSYYVRLGSLSSRLRRRAYSRTLAKLQEAKQRSKGFIEEFNVTVDLVGPHFWLPHQMHPLLQNAQEVCCSQIEYSIRNLDSANQMVGDKLSSLVAWRANGLSAEVRTCWVIVKKYTRSICLARLAMTCSSKLALTLCARATFTNLKDFYFLSTQAIESRTLALARSLSQQLQTSCLVVVSGVQGLPNHVQQEALSLSRSAAQLYTSFGLLSRLRVLPDSVLGGTRVQLGQMKESLDNVMDYLVNNTPLNWLVGPFYPSTTPKGISTLGPSPSSQPRAEKPLEMQMEALSHEQQS